MPNIDTYFLGATQIAVATGITATPVVPGPYCNGGFFKIMSGAGTLSIVPTQGTSYSLGYPVGASEVVSFSGPARFFLSAATATMVVAMVPSYSAGFSAGL